MGPKRNPSDRMRPCCWRECLDDDWTARTFQREWLEGFGDDFRVQDGWIIAAGRRIEAITEALPDAGHRGLIAVNIKSLAHAVDNGPEIVDPVKLVGMVMGDEHGIEPTDMRGEQLAMHIGRSVHENACLAGALTFAARGSSTGADDFLVP